MAFENVNVTSLKNALIQCKNSIDHSTTNGLINDVSNSSVWECEAKNNLKSALEKLENERYKELEDKIDSYINVASDIEKYQKLEQENDTLQVKYNNLSNKLYYKETKDVKTTDSDGNEITKKETKTKKDYSVETQMKSVKNQIKDNTTKMNELKNRVSSSIYERKE